MTPTSIAGVRFLADPSLIQVFSAIENAGGVARVVGGAVRNSLLGLDIDDVDIATTLLPDATIKAAAAAGLKSVPTGIEHGTVTVISAGKGFEVTTLRADVETDGRRAVVAFTHDFSVDAERRDFTMNAIYADRDGTLFDPTGGISDVVDRRVRFIGSAVARIREDYLRILRFFRFHARFGRGAPDAEGLAACIRLRDGIARLSRERVGQEMCKLVMAEKAAVTLQVMADAGILAQILKNGGYPDRFARIPEDAGLDLRLAVLAVDRVDEIAGLAEDLRLPNELRSSLEQLVTAAVELGVRQSEDDIKLAIYRHGNDAASNAIQYNGCRSGRPMVGLALSRGWQAPAFPISGKDLIAQGITPGPELGRKLRELEAAWIARGYRD